MENTSHQPLSVLRALAGVFAIDSKKWNNCISVVQFKMKAIFLYFPFFSKEPYQPPLV